jgi:ubiquinone/menaquinone biosynthesis C-methylase UbiE
MSERADQWNASYERRENFVFAPNEQVVRFISKYVRKRTGLHEFNDVLKLGRPPKLLDLGCGIGRHLVFAAEMGLEPYGVDLSPVAVKTAREWTKLGETIAVASVTDLPFDDNFFDVTVSHGVLDSMTFDIAQKAVAECSRVLHSAGLFYCDMISPDDSRHGREFAGEEVVSTTHERDTIQSYFNFAKIQKLFEPRFEIIEATLVKNENLLIPASNARTHVVLRNRKTA